VLPDHTAAAPDRLNAQTVFYIARGIAVLLAAAAIGIGAVLEDTHAVSPAPYLPYPSSPQATAH
jgi:hypothetical protein